MRTYEFNGAGTPRQRNSRYRHETARFVPGAYRPSREKKSCPSSARKDRNPQKSTRPTVLGEVACHRYLGLYDFFYLRRQCETRTSYEEPVSNELTTLLFAKRFVDDAWFPLLKDFDLARMLFDEKDYGGTVGIYPSKTARPDGSHRSSTNR